MHSGIFSLLLYFLQSWCCGDQQQTTSGMFIFVFGYSQFWCTKQNLSGNTIEIVCFSSYAFTPLIDVGEEDDDDMTLSDAFRKLNTDILLKSKCLIGYFIEFWNWVYTFFLHTQCWLLYPPSSKDVIFIIIEGMKMRGKSDGEAPSRAEKQRKKAVGIIHIGRHKPHVAGGRGFQ